MLRIQRYNFRLTPPWSLLHHPSIINASPLFHIAADHEPLARGSPKLTTAGGSLELTDSVSRRDVASAALSCTGQVQKVKESNLDLLLPLTCSVRLQEVSVQSTNLTNQFANTYFQDSVTLYSSFHQVLTQVTTEFFQIPNSFEIGCNPSNCKVICTPFQDEDN
ncbi:hypothetical protein GH733_019247 [Mirounga leonina]|nr:hypothetical protein GH733_019247 [Mirounga leonina]